MTNAATYDPFEWTITPATHGYHVRHKGQIVRHFYEIEHCARFIRIARADREAR
jgi:hypothetical protein